MRNWYFICLVLLCTLMSYVIIEVIVNGLNSNNICNVPCNGSNCNCVNQGDIESNKSEYGLSNQMFENNVRDRGTEKQTNQCLHNGIGEEITGEIIYSDTDSNGKLRTLWINQDNQLVETLQDTDMSIMYSLVLCTME